MFEAKWVGTSDVSGVNSTLQTAAYPAWPPEIDVAETEYSGSGTGPASGFGTNTHCSSTNSNGRNVDFSPLNSLNMTSWHTYELDLAASSISLDVDGTQDYRLTKSDSWCAAMGTGHTGYGGHPPTGRQRPVTHSANSWRSS